MATGTLKLMGDSMDSCLITPDWGSESLVAPISAIHIDGFKSLKEGQRVTYKITNCDSGKKQANDIRPLAYLRD